MNIASYGGGTNSTAMLIECVNKGVEVELILFADTGGEKPHTYKYIKTFSKWLVDHGMPKITTVQTQDINGTYITLEQKCLTTRSLPSIAYGLKSCSQKHKIRPVDKFMNNYQPAKDAWKRGEIITKLIGFDADEPQRAAPRKDEKYENSYPLIEWWMGREECIETIKEAGLCLPGKSACFYCPSSKPSEIRQLAQIYPELAERALRMERDADLTDIKGLGRSYAWADILRTEEMFDDWETPEFICDCWDG